MAFAIIQAFTLRLEARVCGPGFRIRVRGLGCRSSSCRFDGLRLGVCGAGPGVLKC